MEIIDKYEILFLEREGPVWATSLRPKGVTTSLATSQQLMKTYLSTTPKSHKRYAFTIKVVAIGLYTFLNEMTEYYHHVMCELLQQFPYARNAIWVEEIDSKGIKHIHGILTHSKRSPIDYKAINEHFEGMHIYFRKIIGDANQWRKYILKSNKTINIAQFGRIKILPKDMTICHIENNIENVDLADEDKSLTVKSVQKSTET